MKELLTSIGSGAGGAAPAAGAAPAEGAAADEKPPVEEGAFSPLFTLHEEWDISVR